MKDIKMVVFDMAGTTVDEDNIVYKTVHKVLVDEGCPVSLQEVLKHAAGKEKFQAIRDVVASISGLPDPEGIACRAFAQFKITLEQQYDHVQIKGFDGVEQLFEKLRAGGVKVVLNTGYSKMIAHKLLTKLGWETGTHIDALVTADDVARSRPYPDMIFKAMALFDINNPALVLKAGDSDVDIMEGKNAGCGMTVGVLSGAQGRLQLEAAAPDYIFDKLTGIESLLHVHGLPGI